MAPAYLAADCQLVSDEGRRPLRSATSRTCVVRRTYSNYGDRYFAAAGPRLWNSLPADLRQADISFEQFKRLLKTFLFGCWDRGALWLTVNLRLINSLTYLLTYLHFCVLTQKLHRFRRNLAERWFQWTTYSKPYIPSPIIPMVTRHVIVDVMWPEKVGSFLILPRLP